MKILVLGAGGMIGHTAALWLRERGYDVTGFCRTGSPVCACIRGDARDAGTLDRLLTETPWTHIVNCVGLLNRDCDADPCAAIEINSLLPRRLQAHCRQSGAYLVHISTDYVFSGSRGRYLSSDPPDGSTLYARTKALGEVRGPNAVTLRTSVVGPDLRADGTGLFHWFMNAPRGAHGYTGAFWTGLGSVTLAALIEQCLLHRAAGLYQPVPEERISKYALLALFDRVFRAGEVGVVPDGTLQSDTSLVPDALPFAFRVPGYEEMALQMKDWIRAHAGLYPHYHPAENEQ